MTGCTERNAKIERENRLLLQKMTEIMSKPSIDSRNERASKPHNLHHFARQRELDRIAAENSVCCRICNSAPVSDMFCLWFFVVCYHAYNCMYCRVVIYVETASSGSSQDFKKDLRFIATRIGMNTRGNMTTI